MPRYSVIVPVYNRSEEVHELLMSLDAQTFSDFEVLIVEDGSVDDCKSIIKANQQKLDIKYFTKENSGQGYSRNFGAKHAKGEWLVFFDSDCVIPKDYFSNLEKLIDSSRVDAFSGPDTASPDFSVLQKAISYSMTSLFTTGGIRGNKNGVVKVGQLRSYNMVVKKTVFNALNGFGKTNMGEDMEFSHRFHNRDYHAVIAQDLFVYHKRRNSTSSFFRQILSFGRTRIILKRDFGIPIKLAHYFPVCFLSAFLISFLGASIGSHSMKIALGIFGFYFFIILIDSSIKWKNLIVGIISIITSFIQLSAYGLGMVKEWFSKS